MRTPVRHVLGWLAAATLLAPASARAQTWGQFGVDVLPLPVGSYGFWRGGVVNDAGQVAGRLSVGSVFEAFLFDPGAATPVQPLGFLDPTRGDRNSFGRGINNAGDVVGRSRNTTGIGEAFLHDGSAMQGLGALVAGGSDANAVNDAGQVTGGSGGQAFLSDGPGTAMQGLGFLDPARSDRSSAGSAINESGQVTGFSRNADGFDEAFVSDGPGTAMQGLGFLDPARGDRNSYGFAINEAGQVTGYSRNAAGRNEAFLSDGAGTTMQGLGALGGTESYGRGISDAGQVVGYAAGGSLATWRAALWEGGTGYFLDAIVGSGWTFYEALGMSGAGTVLVRGVNHAVNGGTESYAVLRQLDDPNMAVVPEPSTWLLLATGLAGIGVAARRRREKVGEET